MKSVYLAGPISGLTYKDAVTWREYAKSVFEKYNVDVKTPMRGKEFCSNIRVFDNQGIEGSPLTSQHAIVTRDRNDVMTSDVILMNLIGTSVASIGTVCEIAWADAYRKPVVTVLDIHDKTNPHTHAFVKELSGFIVLTVDDAIKVALSVLNKL